MSVLLRKGVLAAFDFGIITAFKLKRSNASSYSLYEYFADEQESPYYVRRFDCPEEIRKLMQDLQVEDSSNDREPDTPPPLPNLSLRAAADNLYLMSNIYEKID